MTYFEKQQMIQRATRVAMAFSFEGQEINFKNILAFITEKNLTPSGLTPNRFAGMISQVIDGNSGFATPTED
jgi:hypothetical protein